MPDVIGVRWDEQDIGYTCPYTYVYTRSGFRFFVAQFGDQLDALGRHAKHQSTTLCIDDDDAFAGAHGHRLDDFQGSAAAAAQCTTAPQPPQHGQQTDRDRKQRNQQIEPQTRTIRCVGRQCAARPE